YVQSDAESVRILDPGCGTGILSCVLVEHIIVHHTSVRNIHLVGFETDTKLYDYLKQSFDYLKDWASNNGVSLTYEIHTDDFTLEIVPQLSALTLENDGFDIIISNPPYFKLAKDDPRTLAARPH